MMIGSICSSVYPFTLPHQNVRNLWKRLIFHQLLRTKYNASFTAKYGSEHMDFNVLAESSGIAMESLVSHNLVILSIVYGFTPRRLTFFFVPGISTIVAVSSTTSLSPFLAFISACFMINKRAGG